MRKKIVAGNWKMNKNADEARSLYKSILAAAKDLQGQVEIIVAPPALYLSEFAQYEGRYGSLSAQNCAMFDNGAYTGEVSAAMLESAKIPYCILGHSERRQYFSETDKDIAAKLFLCFANNVMPIYCCGEVKEEREGGTHEMVVKKQVETALSGLSSDEVKKMIIAYEPVWAIGTGLTATSAQAQDMHAFIRSLLLENFGEDTAESTRILYGGSVKPANAAELFSQPDVDGGLIGGAALNVGDFISIAKAAV